MNLSDFLQRHSQLKCAEWHITPYKPVIGMRPDEEPRAKAEADLRILDANNNLVCVTTSPAYTNMFLNMPRLYRWLTEAHASQALEVPVSAPEPVLSPAAGLLATLERNLQRGYKTTDTAFVINELKKL